MFWRRMFFLSEKYFWRCKLLEQNYKILLLQIGTKIVPFFIFLSHQIKEKYVIVSQWEIISTFFLFTSLQILALDCKYRITSLEVVAYLHCSKLHTSSQSYKRVLNYMNMCYTQEITIQYYNINSCNALSKNVRLI